MKQIISILSSLNDSDPTICEESFKTKRPLVDNSLNFTVALIYVYAT